MKRTLLLFALFMALSSGCTDPKPVEMEKAVMNCSEGGRECFEKRLGPANVVEITETGCLYMRWEGKGSFYYAPSGTGYGGKGAPRDLPCTLEIYLDGNTLVDYQYSGPCTDPVPRE